MAIEYSEAVHLSKEFIAVGARDLWDSPHKTEIEAIAGGVLGAGRLRASLIGPPYDENSAARLLAWAETDARFFDEVRLGIAYLLEQGEELPPEALQWLVRHLRGQVTRPKARAGRKMESQLHFVIWMAVGTLVEKGMKATRNEASPATSACDAVADALAELGMEPATFGSVKRIWERFERKRKTAPDTT